MSRLTNLVLVLLVLPLLGCKINNGMEKHLVDAIELYSFRMALYHDLTQGKSDKLFKKLIADEKLSLGVARIFDVRAYAFSQTGIAIVEADFVSMDGNAGFGAAIAYASKLDAIRQTEVQKRLSNFKPAENNFVDVSNQCFQLLIWIDDFERKHNLYLPMTKHLVESIGFSALHAPVYMAQSSGATFPLSRDMVKMQIFVLRNLNPLEFDVAANTFHQDGIGVLVNDLPHIPFVEEYLQLGTN